MRRYFMVNGPLGGNMGTPPVAPQPPQVSFTTTAESRGGFNNFLKSIPATTSMTPLPPMGSSPTMPMANPMGNPMGNIDIFNQPPSMGMMGMNQPQMNPMMQPPMQPPNIGLQAPMMGGIMGTPVQNFYNGGGVDDFSDFGGFSDSSDPFGGGDSFNDSNDTSDPSIGGDSSFNEENFQSALDNISLGSDDQAFADDPAIVDRRGINVGLENTGGFTTGVVPNLRGERFTRFESVPYAQRALGRDFQTKVNRNVLNEAGDNALTYGDYFEKFTPSSENPGGTGNRMADFTKATGKGPNDMLSITDMPNIMDIQGKYEAGIRGVEPGKLQKIASTVNMNNDRDIANILLSDLDLSKVDPTVASTVNQNKSFVQSQPEGALKNSVFDYVPDGFQMANYMNQRGGQAPTGVAPVGSQGAGSRGDAVQPMSEVDAFGDPTRVTPVDSFGDPARVDPNVMTESAIKTGTGKIAGMNENTFRSLSSDAQQKILNDIRTADMGTTFTNYDSQPNYNIVPDTALETMAGGNFGRSLTGPPSVGDTSLEIINPSASFLRSEADRKNAILDRDAMNQDFDRIDRAEDSSIVDDSTFITTRPEDYEENVGRAFDANRMADIERLYNRNVGQGGIGVGDALNTSSSKGKDSTFFEGLGVPGIATTIGDFIERKSRENMANEIALGRPMGLGETLFGYDANPAKNMEEYMSNVQPNYDFGDFNQTSKSIPESQLVRNDSGRIIGIYNEKGRLVSGYDPDAPVDTGDDNDSNPLILRRIAKEKEEEKEKEDKPPNVFGGAGSIAPITPKSVVVDSPFTTNVGDYSPTGFDSGDLNALIAQLLKTSNPKKAAQGGVIGYANGGGVDQALDRFLASA